jgi:uncharacterized protein (TIGR02452 family)
MDVYYKRIEIWKDTQNYANRYHNDCAESIKYKSITDDHLENTNNTNNTYTYTEIKVIRTDTIDALVSIINNDNDDNNNNDDNPVLLNMADPSIPGGCVNMGASAQEENIFRRTNYFMTLKQQLYYPLLDVPHLDDPRLFDTDTIYSKDVTLFRSSEETGYQFVEPIKICIIASAAVRHPELRYDTNDNPDYRNESDRDLMFQKICMIFKTAVLHNHNVIVLSAFGCGAFKNPPKVVAELFGKAIEQYKKYFKKIIFAIKQPVDAQSKNNYQVFHNVLLGSDI